MTPTRALLAALLATASPAGADVVVLHASIPELAPGQVIASDARVRLPPGATLSVMTDSGEIRALDGPHDGPFPGAAAASGGGALQVVAELIKGRRDAVAVMGATRGAEIEAPDSLDPATDAVFCVVAGVRPAIAVAPRGVARVLQIAGPGAVEVAVPPGATHLAWPDALPLKPGRPYRFVLGGTQIGLTDLRLIDALPASPGEQVALLARRGCQRQALALLGTHARAAGP